MNLEEMKLKAQDAFVQKKITQEYVTAFSPEKMLKVLAVLNAATELNEKNLDLEHESGRELTVEEAILADACTYLKTQDNEAAKPKIYTC